MFPKTNMSKAIVGGICAFIYSLEGQVNIGKTLHSMLYPFSYRRKNRSLV
jgi:hypothetical protein